MKRSVASALSLEISFFSFPVQLDVLTMTYSAKSGSADSVALLSMLVLDEDERNQECPVLEDVKSEVRTSSRTTNVAVKLRSSS